MSGRIWALVAAAVAAWLSLGAGGAFASVTLGRTAPPSSSCGVSDDLLQPTTTGNSYVAQGGGTITSWSTYGPASGSGSAKLKVFRKVSATRYSVVTQDVFRTISSPGPFTRNVTIGGVQAGDVIGLTVTGLSGCVFSAPPGDRYLLRAGDLSNGAAGDFSTSSPNFGVNVSAVLDPSHKFTIGATTRHKNKGTATLSVDFPGPGRVTLSGKGVKGAGQPITVAGSGALGLLIKATGSKRATLFDRGKVTLNLGLSYTPTGGTAGTGATKVKLKKRLG